MPVSHNTLYSFIWRQRDRGVIPVVTNRDLRRTGKTLAGKGKILWFITRPDLFAPASPVSREACGLVDSTCYAGVL